MNKKIVFNVTSALNFVNFLNRFSIIDSTLLVEVYSDCLKAKTNTPDRSVVKYSKILLEDVFERQNDEDEAVELMFGIYSIKTFVSAFSQFGDSDIKLIIEYVDIEGKNIGTNLTILGSKLNIRFDCASQRMFTYISDDIMTDVIIGDTSNSVSFDIDKNTQNQIRSLCTFDDDKMLTFKSDKKTITASGKNFDLNVFESDVEYEKLKTTVNKSHFILIDKEDNEISINESKIIISSLESDTIMVIGRAEE